MHTLIDIDKLSSVQRALLMATATNKGTLQIAMRVDAHGWVVMAGKRVFADPHSREFAEEHLAGVGQLQELQLLRAAGKRGQYELTNVGWEMSRKLRHA